MPSRVDSACFLVIQSHPKVLSLMIKKEMMISGGLKVISVYRLFNLYIDVFLHKDSNRVKTTTGNIVVFVFVY